MEPIKKALGMFKVEYGVVKSKPNVPGSLNDHYMPECPLVLVENGQDCDANDLCLQKKIVQK